MTTWSVPRPGYGLPDNASASDDADAGRPLYTHGGTGLRQTDIVRFEVRTGGGKRLVSIGL
ncbi:hypothetical protein NKH77_24635 [Streptomyces sp. M19]